MTPSEEWDFGCTLSGTVRDGYHARTLSLMGTASPPVRYAPLPSDPQIERRPTPLPVDETVRRVVHALIPGFFRRAPNSPDPTVAATSTVDARVGTTQWQIVVQLPPTEAVAVSAIVRSLLVMAPNNGLKNLIVTDHSTDGRLLEVKQASHLPRTKPVKPRFNVEMGYPDFEAIIAVELESHIQPDIEEQLRTITNAWGALVDHGSIEGDELRPFCSGVVTEASIGMPNEWIIKLEAFQGDHATFQPLLGALVLLHQRCPIALVEVS